MTESVVHHGFITLQGVQYEVVAPAPGAMDLTPLDGSYVNFEYPLGAAYTAFRKRTRMGVNTIALFTVKQETNTRVFAVLLNRHSKLLVGYWGGHFRATTSIVYIPRDCDVTEQYFRLLKLKLLRT